MISSAKLQWLVYGFLAIIVAVVFQQIATSMTEQGIANGGPYNNGAAYPRAIAIAIGLLVVGQIIVDFAAGRHETSAGSAAGDDPPEELIPEEPPIERSDLTRAVLLLIVFAVYLLLLKTLGYHLTTTPMVFAIMWICGARNPVKLVIASLILAFVFAYIFEKFLNVVLPGGIFALNIPW